MVGVNYFIVKLKRLQTLWSLRNQEVMGGYLLFSVLLAKENPMILFWFNK